MNRPPAPLPDNGDITFTNLWQNATVPQRMVIVHGRARAGTTGSIITYYHNNSFPSQRFPLQDGEFKALVALETGANKIMFEADDGRGGGKPARAELVLNYHPIVENPPVHFVLLLGKDSPGTFDSPQSKRQHEEPNLDAAVRKLRLASYLMAAYTQEQMRRNKFGLRTFRPHEEFEPDTLSTRDTVPQRFTTHIHIVRMDKTVAEIRDPDIAQQNPDAKHGGDLFGMAHEALRKYGGPFATDKFVQAACIYLDAHWDPDAWLVGGHAALGGGIGNFKLAIFGSHLLHAWPKSLEELPAAFLDESRTNEREVANDAKQSGSSWEALNIGMGAFMHEVGHLLGCPHEPDGIMLRGYLNWNRSFMATEGFSTRENKRALTVVRPQDEGWWHRLDIMRFRFHPSFRLPQEPKFYDGSKPLVFPTANGISVRAPMGIFMIDVHVDGDSRFHFEYERLPQEVELTLQQIEEVLPRDMRRGKVIEIHTHSVPMEQTNIDDVRAFVEKNKSGSLLQSSSIGREDGERVTVTLPDEPLLSVRVWAGDALDGLEFFYKGGSVLFGKQGGKPHDIRIEPGDTFRGLAIRGGYWIDAGGIVTDKFVSPQFGGPGGNLVQLVPPRGRRIAGLTGWVGGWFNGIAIQYER